MGAACVLSLRSPVWHLRQNLCVLLGLGLLLAGCSTSDHHNVTAPTAASPQLEQQAIANLLDLYRQALLQEDIDRLQALLAAQTPSTPSGTPRQQATARQEDGGTWTDAAAFRTAMSTAFRTLTMSGFELPAETVQVAADRRSVALLEIEHTEDPALLVQQTRLFRTTWRLTSDQGPGVTTFRIGAVQREGPVVQVTTRGQIQAGALSRVEVTDTGTLFGLAAATVPKPTVAQYAQYFRYLEVGVFANRSGPYVEALRHPMMVVYRNFPEKWVLMGEGRVRKSLKRHHLSSPSFSKKLLLGRVRFSSRSLTVGSLP